MNISLYFTSRTENTVKYSDLYYIKVGEDLCMDTDKKLHLEKQNVYGYCFRITRNVFIMRSFCIIVLKTLL